jgi:hypothetical protein
VALLGKLMLGAERVNLQLELVNALLAELVFLLEVWAGNR